MTTFREGRLRDSSSATSPTRGSRAKVADWAEGANYLVNSAGVILIKPIFELTVEDWRRVQAINAEATFFLCQKIGPRLGPGGSIVNLSSSSAKLATTDRSRGLCRIEDHDPFDHPLLRLRSCRAAGQGQRDPAGIVDTPMQEEVLERVAPMRGTTRRTAATRGPSWCRSDARFVAGRMRRPDLVPPLG